MEGLYLPTNKPFSLHLIPSNVALYHVNQNGTVFIETLNRRALMTEKLSAEDVEGKKLVDVFPGAAETGLVDLIRRVYYTGVTESLENAYYKDERISAWRRYKVYKLDDGRLMSIYENIPESSNSLRVSGDKKQSSFSDRKRDDKEVLLTLFDKGSSVLFKWNNDARWNVLYISKSVERLLGYTRDEFLKNKVSFSSCVHPDDLQRVSQEVGDAVRSGKEYFEHQPYRLYTKSGAIKWVYDSTVIIRNSKGEAINFIGYTIDITDIKKKEQQLLLHVKQAQMGEMISMIAHQWRQPLATISVRAANIKMNLLFKNYDFKDEKKSEEFVKYLDDSLSEIERLTQVLSQTVDDFRTFYMPDKSPVKQSVKEPIIKAVEIVQSSLKENRVSLYKNFQSTKKIELFDTEMMQVLVNILKNSEDNFLEKRIETPKIYINTYDLEDGVIIEVLDNGTGIDESVLDRIYEPYFSTKTQKNGTGLGLYMSKMIVEEHHNGTIEVKNFLEGVCFRIRLFDTIAKK